MSIEIINHLLRLPELSAAEKQWLDMEARAITDSSPLPEDEDGLTPLDHARAGQRLYVWFLRGETATKRHVDATLLDRKKAEAISTLVCEARRGYPDMTHIPGFCVADAEMCRAAMVEIAEAIRLGRNVPNASAFDYAKLPAVAAALATVQLDS